MISLGVVGWMALRLNNDLRDRQVEHTQIMHQVDAVDDHVMENRQILREIERTRGMLYRLCIQGSMTAHEIAGLRLSRSQTRGLVLIVHAMSRAVPDSGLGGDGMADNSSIVLVVVLVVLLVAAIPAAAAMIGTFRQGQKAPR